MCVYARVRVRMHVRACVHIFECVCVFLHVRACACICGSFKHLCNARLLFMPDEPTSAASATPSCMKIIEAVGVVEFIGIIRVIEVC